MEKLCLLTWIHIIFYGVQNSSEKELLEVAVKDLCLRNLQSMKVSSTVCVLLPEVSDTCSLWR